MLSQELLADAICEAATEADALVEEYLKKYVERRLGEEIAVINARLETLEDFLTRPKGRG